MKIYLKNNVYDEALERIRWLFDEFPNVVVGYSGGKDSTVVYNLSLIIAKEKNRLPLKVMFLDQEAEWQATIDQVTLVMENPDVEPMWMQMPIKLFNASSTTDTWLQCWNPKEKDKWMHSQVDYSYKENKYGTDRFADVFEKILAVEFPDTKTCYIAGVRTEESPTRFVALTHQETYKGQTYGKKLNVKLDHYTFYPIYDWSYTDIWASIHKNKWEYNKIYDAQYSYGMTVNNMRVSNVHHETAVHSLFYMQEVEPETYVKLTQRIGGIDSAGKAGKDDYFVKTLPYMFASWKEYRDYLLEKLIINEKWKEIFVKKFKQMEKLYETDIGDKLHKACIQSILTNDWELIKLKNFERAPQNYVIKRKALGKEVY